MELEQLINETMSLLNINIERIDNFQGIKITLDSHTLFLEKMPDKDVLILSLPFCHYYDTDNLQKLFEILLNIHAFGILTKEAYFAADSDDEVIIFHKIIALQNLQAEELAELIREFYDVFVMLEKTWKNGEFDVLAKTASAVKNTIADSSHGIRV